MVQRTEVRLLFWILRTNASVIFPKPTKVFPLPEILELKNLPRITSAFLMLTTTGIRTFCKLFIPIFKNFPMKRFLRWLMKLKPIKTYFRRSIPFRQQMILKSSIILKRARKLRFYGHLALLSIEIFLLKLEILTPKSKAVRTSIYGFGSDWFIR